MTGKISKHAVNLVQDVRHISLRALEHNAILLDTRRLNEHGRALLLQVRLEAAVRNVMHLPVKVGNSLRCIAHWSLYQLDDCGSVRLPEAEHDLLLRLVELEVAFQEGSQLVEREVLAQHLLEHLFLFIIESLVQI